MTLSVTFFLPILYYTVTQKNVVYNTNKNAQQSTLKLALKTTVRIRDLDMVTLL